MNTQNDEVEIDLLEIFYVLKSKIVIILASMVLVAGLFAVYSLYLTTPVYQSSSRLYILTKSTSITSLADIQMGTSLTQDYKELITSRTVVEQVIENLGLSYTYGDMLQQISIENPSNTRIIKITVRDNVPEDAKLIVDELTDVARAKISAIMATDAPNVVEYGTVPVNPVSPNKKKNVVIGALLGAFIACAIIVVRFLLDDTVKNADDIEKYLGMNTLASIPLKEEEDKKKKKSKKNKKTKDSKKGAKA